MEAGFFIVFVLFMMVLVLVPLGLLIWAIVDIVKRPSWAWDRSQQQQVVWILIVLLGSIIGMIVYYVVAKPKLDEAMALGPPPVPTPPPSPGPWPSEPGPGPQHP